MLNNDRSPSLSNFDWLRLITGPGYQPLIGHILGTLYWWPRGPGWPGGEQETSALTPHSPHVTHSSTLLPWPGGNLCLQKHSFQWYDTAIYTRYSHIQPFDLEETEAVPLLSSLQVYSVSPITLVENSVLAETSMTQPHVYFNDMTQLSHELSATIFPTKCCRHQASAGSVTPQKLLSCLSVSQCGKMLNSSDAGNVNNKTDIEWLKKFIDI